TAVITRFPDQALGLLHVPRILLDVARREAGAAVQRAGRDARIAEKGDIAHRFSVKRIHDRLAETYVVDRLFAVIEPEEGLRADKRPALFGDGRTGQFRQALDIEILDTAGGQHIDLAGLEGSRARCGVRDDVEIDAFDRGDALFVVVLVGYEMDVGAAHPLIELQRPGADRRVVRRIIDEIAALVDVLRNHRH